MATQQSIPQVVQQSKLVVVPFPAPQAITQLELSTLLSLRGRLHQLQDQVQQAEQSIKTRLETGALLEAGDHKAELKDNFRRNVAWKDVVVRLAERLRMDGEAYCARVLASTKPTRTLFLVVE
ncbi:MAG TPA: hypothetical protein VOA41_11425 [Candidatus Dormibacteraeota bacterium]|nr:hypothetical protein [Candidatus Dormibacteraeota bacterium]